MKYLITIILILTLFTGCAVRRYSNPFNLKPHPVRPDICPKEFITPGPFPTHYMPGDPAYAYKSVDPYKHQRCYDLYGGCSHYRLDIDVFSGPDAGCTDWQIDKETCLAKGGEWYNYNFIGWGKWCWWPIEE